MKPDGSLFMNYKDWAYIGGAALFTLAISLLALMGKGLRLDEAQSVWQTNHSLYGTLSILAQDIQLPLYYVGLRFWEMAFGTSVQAIRSFSLIFLILSFPAIFLLAKKAYSRTVGYAVILLSAASPFLQWFGSEARMYSLLFLLTSLNHLYFLRLWKEENPQTKDWILYGVTAALGAYTHYFFIFVLLVQAGFYLLKKDLFPQNSLKRFSLVAGIIATELILWFLLRLNVGTSHAAPQLSSPTSSDLFNLFSHAFIGFQTNAINSFFLSMWPILMLAGFALLIKRQRAAPETIYLFYASFVPVILAFLTSIFIKPMFLSRYLIVTLPSLYLLAAYLISLYGLRAQRLIMTGIIVAMLFSLGVQIYSPGIPVHENYREAAHYISESADPNDLVVLSAPFTTYPIEYYYKGKTPLVTFPRWARYEDIKSIPPYSDESFAAQMETWDKTYKDLYVLMSYDQGYEEKERLYLDTHYERIDSKEFSPGLNLYVYKLRYL